VEDVLAVMRTPTCNADSALRGGRDSLLHNHCVAPESSSSGRSGENTVDRRWPVGRRNPCAAFHAVSRYRGLGCATVILMLLAVGVDDGCSSRRGNDLSGCSGSAHVMW
jgi:hypothetical protein